MVKKKAAPKQEEVNVVQEPQAIEPVVQEVKQERIPNITHYAFSMVDNENGTYSAVKIGFNLKEKYVSPKIEVVETNTDKYIVQERVGIAVLDMEHGML